MITEASILAARILIVDDEAAGVRLLELTLRGAGFTHVSCTLDSREVVELHRAHRYDLILLDLKMPKMDGFAVMDALKQLELDSYVCVLAVTASVGQRVRALRSGAKDFVSKPFDLAEILMRVRNLLEVRLLHEVARENVKALEVLAGQDPLTGLANRRMAAESMRQALAHGRLNKNAMAVLYLDLDGFKSVNDTFGHGVGDLLLKQVAKRLVSLVREEDTVARLGGDEFMVALWQVRNETDAALVASKLIEAISVPFELDGQQVHVTASAGIAMFPSVGEDAETLMRHADQALYAAKQLGKNAFQVFRPDSESTRNSRWNDSEEDCQTSPVAL